jgi:GNAT superfamily N-acetyltransferase
VEIRPASPSDGAVLGGLISRFFAEEGFAAPSGVVARRTGVFLQQPNNAAFVAYDGEAAVGAVTVTTSYGLEVGWCAEIEDLYVLPGRRRHGLGGRLLDAALAWCRERGCSKAEIIVTPDGEVRHGLTGWYVERGFSDGGRRLLELPL